jgi:hypothetical protein
MVSVGSVQPGLTFRLFGSNTQGTLGTQVGAPTAVPSMGNLFRCRILELISSFPLRPVGDVLPVAFEASIQAVPEFASGFPVAGLGGVVVAVEMLRRRRNKKLS